MEAAALLQLISVITPYLIKAGIDGAEMFKRMRNGETVEQLMAELDLKANDLQPLDFGEDTSSTAAKLMKENNDNQDG